MNEEKELTGYPLVDNVLSERYVTNPITNIKPDSTMYELYVNSSAKNRDNIAVYSYSHGTKYTHKELLELIEKVASGFVSLGLKEGMKAGCFLNITYETPVVLLALNKIGVTVQFLDCTKSTQYIVESTAVSNPDIFIVDEALKDLGTMVNIQKRPMIIAAASKYDYDDSISFERLIDIGSKCMVANTVNFDSKRASIIITSSGTTGAPKPIVHTDFSVNSAVKKMVHSNYPFGKDSLLLCVVPPHIGLGLVTSLYTGLISGTPVVMVPGYGPEDSVAQTLDFINKFNDFSDKNNISKSVQTLIFASPIFYRVIFNEGKLDDMSFIKVMLAAGSKMSEKELLSLCEIARAKGCFAPICNGYGQNEMCGAVTLNDNLYNKNGSAGYPTYGTRIRIIDSVTHEILPLGETGKIVEQSDSEFLCYEKMPDKTNKAKIILADGTTWFDTNDIGYFSEDGFLYITGRESRIVIKCDLKIPLDVIEGKMRQFPFIKDCAVIIKPYSENEELIAYIISDDNSYSSEKIFAEIRKNNVLSEFEMPEEIIIISEFPVLSSGKVDYRKLEEMAEIKETERL